MQWNLHNRTSDGECTKSSYHRGGPIMEASLHLYVHYILYIANKSLAVVKGTSIKHRQNPGCIFPPWTDAPVLVEKHCCFNLELKRWNSSTLKSYPVLQMVLLAQVYHQHHCHHWLQAVVLLLHHQSTSSSKVRGSIPRARATFISVSSLSPSFVLLMEHFMIMEEDVSFHAWYPPDPIKYCQWFCQQWSRVNIINFS